MSFGAWFRLWGFYRAPGLGLWRLLGSIEPYLWIRYPTSLRVRPQKYGTCPSILLEFGGPLLSYSMLLAKETDRTKVTDACLWRMDNRSRSGLHQHGDKAEAMKLNRDAIPRALPSPTNIQTATTFTDPNGVLNIETRSSPLQSLWAFRTP